MMKIITLASVESTNRYCEFLDLSEVEELTCYRALEQTAGIGQSLTNTASDAEGGRRHNQWFSGLAGENLAVSIVLKPTFLPAAAQFRLTQALSLAICDFLSGLDIRKPIQIKWPNDIYVAGNKICGTLISTRLCQSPQSLDNNDSHAAAVISTAICGIGLNVNQTSFPAWVPNPTSVALLTGRRHDCAVLLHGLLEACRRRYQELRDGCDPTSEYLARLMNLGVARRYRYCGEELTATVTGVDLFGRLCLTTADDRPLVCSMKEITFLP